MAKLSGGGEGTHASQHPQSRGETRVLIKPAGVNKRISCSQSTKCPFSDRGRWRLSGGWWTSFAQLWLPLQFTLKSFHPWYLDERFGPGYKHKQGSLTFIHVSLWSVAFLCSAPPSTLTMRSFSPHFRSLRFVQKIDSGSLKWTKSTLSIKASGLLVWVLGITLPAAQSFYLFGAWGSLYNPENVLIVHLQR